MMQGFKNLLPRQLLNDDSVQPVVKKIDQHRKTTQSCLQHFSNIYKNIETFSQSFEGEIFELHHELTETQNRLPAYFLQLSQLFKNINVEVKIFTQKSNGSYRQLSNLCNTLFLEYSNVVLNFQQQIRNYQSMEVIVFEMSKKYSRTFKNMVGYLESYKGSFTDARLIYNTQEKVKRYQQCETAYKGLLEELKVIQEKCERLTEKKTAIRENFSSIENEMKRTIKVIASKSISQIKNFVKNYSQFQKTIVTFLAQKKFSLQKLNIKTIFESISNTNCAEYFNCEVKSQECRILPAIFLYIEQLKSEYIPYCRTAFLNYFKEVNERVDKRKEVNRRVLEFLKVYLQAIEKHQYTNLKEIVGSFQKQKKRFSQLFSSRFVSFMKSIHSIFDLSIGINEKLLKSFGSKLKNIQTYISDENKHMEMFVKELRSNVQKFIGKRQKKPLGSQAASFRDTNSQQTARTNDINKSALFIEDSFVVVDNTQFRKQIKQRSLFLIHLIHGFISKMQSTQKKLKTDINSIVHDYSESTNEFYSLCCQYETIYFGSEEFINNFKKYEADIDKSLQKETGFVRDELGFRGLLEEDQEMRRITFDGEIAKVDEFKKLKKPVGLEGQGSQSKKTISQGLQRKQSTNSSEFNDQQSGSKSPPASTAQASSLKDSVNLSASKQPAKQPTPVMAINKSQQKSQKYFQLLSKKVTFQEGQQYIKSFSCAFYDKIILQGRIFITNKRLCFHSKFNPTTIFFGGTFIDIPRKDITKVEKRYNALVFDNSIAITTVNGEMFFTSFFSRDQAFDLINKALDINFEEQFFEPQGDMQDNDKEDEIIEEAEAVEQEDDLNSAEQTGRQEQVTKLLQAFPYQLLHESEFQVPKINAMKFFRLFDSGQQIYLNRRTYKSFLQYCKDLIGHKQIQIHHFKPNILEYLNFNNIKNNTPIKIQRKMNAMVPISAAGVPFMPKAARSDEIQALYFVSKNKYVIQSTIQNSGAPYTDCFNVKLKRTVESVQENKVKFKAQMHVNFVKSTMMKSMIESKALEETRGYFVKMSQEMKKYFKSMEKVKKTEGVKGQGNNEAGKGEQGATSEEIELLRKELQTAMEEKDKLAESVETLKGTESRLKQYLFVAVILNIFLVLLLLN